MKIPLTRGLFALIDPDDFELVGHLKWFARRDCNTFYAKRNARIARGEWSNESMHALITGFAMTDHINGNGLDNRRCNLREADRSRNGMNLRKTHGGSRFKGVTWHKQARRWQAAITAEGKTRYLGLFKEEDAAALAYDHAARLYHGQYAAVNFPRPGERGCLGGEQ